MDMNTDAWIANLSDEACDRIIARAIEVCKWDLRLHLEGSRATHDVDQLRAVIEAEGIHLPSYT